MTRIFLLMLLSLSNTLCAQIHAPDYRNKTHWRYEECDVTHAIEGTDNLVFHEDYEPVASVNKDAFLVVIYKPVSRDLLSESDEKFVNESKQRPWVLIYSSDPDHGPLYLFEHINNEWNLEKTFNSGLEMDKFVRDKYKIQ